MHLAVTITLELTEEAREWLSNKGYDPEYGARPLRRLIQNEIEDVLSDGILSGRFQVAGVVKITTNAEADELLLEQLHEEDAEVSAPSV